MLRYDDGWYVAWSNGRSRWGVTIVQGVTLNIIITSATETQTTFDMVSQTTDIGTLVYAMIHQIHVRVQEFHEGPRYQNSKCPWGLQVIPISEKFQMLIKIVLNIQTGSVMMLHEGTYYKLFTQWTVYILQLTSISQSCILSSISIPSYVLRGVHCALHVKLCIAEQCIVNISHY